MKPTLLVLAAGMGSRYGGLKQLDGLGPNGETIMDYSIYDALQAGFGKVVFVIRKDFEQDFREKVLSKYENHIAVEVVFQDINALPDGYTAPADRTRPWGTNHAVLMGADVIREPFTVINADDYYGQDAFRVMAQELSRERTHAGDYCMVGFRVGNTMSESGAVSRGVCSVKDGLLTGIVERGGIAFTPDHRIAFPDADGNPQYLEANTPVSMNFWGFTPDYFDFSRREFVKFLDSLADPTRGEYYIPTAVNTLITTGEATVKVLDTTSQWFGVTYANDRQHVVDKFAELHANGTYPAHLF